MDVKDNIDILKLLVESALFSELDSFRQLLERKGYYSVEGLLTIQTFLLWKNMELLGDGGDAGASPGGPALEENQLPSKARPGNFASRVEPGLRLKVRRLGPYGDRGGQSGGVKRHTSQEQAASYVHK